MGSACSMQQRHESRASSRTRRNRQVSPRVLTRAFSSRIPLRFSSSLTPFVYFSHFSLNTGLQAWSPGHRWGYLPQLLEAFGGFSCKFFEAKFFDEFSSDLDRLTLNSMTFSFLFI